MTDKLVERLNLLADAFFVEGSCGRDEQYHNIAHTHQQWLTIAHGIREAADALAHALAAGRDTERLDYLETLIGRMYCHPRGKIWPLHTDISLHSNKECSATIYLRDEVGRNAQTASGPTVRAAIDAALREGQVVNATEEK